MTFHVDSEVGRLRQVIVHRPGLELRRITPRTVSRLLFDGLPWVGRAQQEHTVGPGGSSAVFANLQSGRRYCFVVGTVVKSASGQQGTATAPAVCTAAR